MMEMMTMRIKTLYKLREVLETLYIDAGEEEQLLLEDLLQIFDRWGI